jgi:dienelactone hydrolase
MEKALDSAVEMACQEGRQANDWLSGRKMKAVKCLLLAGWATAVVAVYAGEITSQEETTIAAGKAVVQNMVKEQFAVIADGFDAKMKNALPAAKLKTAWQMLLVQAGAYQHITGARFITDKAYKIVFVTCQFERAALDVKIVFDAAGQVAGLLFLPAEPPTAYTPPDYVKRDAFDEKEVLIGVEPWVLPGTLAIPKKSGTLPAVVLVHGSGPHDRDETIGPNKPFRDLAWGLASRGIIVLRYEKRTKAHAQQFTGEEKTKITVKEETIEDAQAAVGLLLKEEKVSKDRIFVLGHSLGGYLAPQIGALDKRIAGIIILAGSARPLEDLVLEQSEYLLSLNSASANEEKLLMELRKQVAAVKSPDLTPATPAESLPLNVPASYWLDLRAYNAPAQAAKLSCGILLLQGERDYQVTMKDYLLWETALSKCGNAKLKKYATLNHLFMEGNGRSTPAEYYALPGHVSIAVIDDVANWLLADKGQ